MIFPNGGEIFHVGDQCTVKVASVRPGNATLHLYLERGLYDVSLTTTHGFNPQTDSMFIVEIPDTFDIHGETVSALSGECTVKIADYSEPTLYFDESDGYFKIVP